MISELFSNWFAEVETNVNISFIGSFIGIFLALIALYPKKKPIRKRISIVQADNRSIIHSFSEYKSDIKILYKDKSVLGLYEALIFLKNEGTEVLKEDDFHDYCQIQFNKKIKIIEVELWCSDKFSRLKFQQTSQSLEMALELIEPKEYIQIKIIYESVSDTELSFISNIIGGEKQNKLLNGYSIFDHSMGTDRDYRFWLYLSIFLTAIIWIIEVFIIEYSLGIEVLDKDFNIVLPYGWYSLLFIIPFIISIIIHRKLFSKRQEWLKIKEWNKIEL